MSDPDYYYHVSLSRQIVESGIPETVPQVQGIGWDILFTDKEFLYHVFTSFFYSWFGEAGVRALSIIFLGITTVTLAFQSLKNLGLRLFLLPLALIAFDPHFLRRMIMVRPQTLAVLLFVFILIGFIHQRKYILLMASALFALSYHGMQVPALLIAAAVFTSFVAQPHQMKYAAYCALGLIAGSLINPYFPGNITVLAQITNIVKQTIEATSTVSYGAEIYPWKASELLQYSLIGFTVVILAFTCLGSLSDSSRESEREDHSRMLFLAVSSCLFFAVAMITPRGREYLIPCLVFLAIQVLRQKPLAGTVLITMMSVAQVFAIQPRYSMLVANEKNVEARSNMMKALEKIPADEKAHVLNCNWSHSPYIMYVRPQLTFVDILDPSYLILANPSLHEARDDMARGKIADLRFVVGDVFKAQYIFCDVPSLNARLDRDPHFARVHPDKPVAKSLSPFAIFKLKTTQPLSNFEREFMYSLPTDREKWTAITADVPGPKGPIASTHLNFRAKLSKEQLSENSTDSEERIANCVFVIPQDLTGHVGADHIGLGGGPNIRVWFNEEPLYENDGEPQRVNALDILLPLPRPLRATDTLKAMVCPGVVQTYFGWSLSFWTTAQMQETCADQTVPRAGETEPIATEWLYKGDQLRNCLGPIASAAKSPLNTKAPAADKNKKKP